MLDVGLLVLRAVVGALLAAHGLQKLTGWWDGPGIDGNATYLERLRYRSPRALSWLHGGAETAGGVLLVLGLATPLAAGLVIAVMLNAMIAVHAGNGLWSQNGGTEYPLVLAAVATALAVAGPGALALDRLVGWEVTGAWTLVGVAGGLVVGLAALALRRPEPSAEDRPQRRPVRVA